MAIQIASLNVKGLRNQSKVSLLSFLIIHKMFDIVFLQETHITDLTQGRQIALEADSRGYWSFGEAHARGVGILIKNSFQCNIISFHSDKEGRFISVDIEISDVRFKLINVYVPNNSVERKRFITDLSQHLNGNKDFILGGDFNFVESLYFDKIGGDPKSGNVGHKEMANLKNDFHLTDAYRELHPVKQVYTFNGHNLSCRLDRFYINKDFTDHIKEVRNIPCSFSDHDFVLLQI